MKKNIMRKWFVLGIINLAIVALYGTLMRYKIVFDFPFLDQKNLLHAHSHFAFSAWISHALYCGLAILLMPHLSLKKQRYYHLLIALNLFCAFGMLIAFTVQGYKTVSIVFSTLSVVVSFIYAISFIRDKACLPASHAAIPWAVAALLLNVLSSLGPFSLAYMMATHSVNTSLYLGSVYYYLHFQYNGWFFFGAMALVTTCLPAGFPSLKKYFNVFALTVIPTFGLSVLWAKLPVWLYIIVVASTFAQLAAWVVLAMHLLRYFRQHGKVFIPAWIRLFFYAAALAFTLKFTLQAVSVIPSLSQLVFGFRPVVIAYLHLVLLGVYSLFIIGYLFSKGWLKPVKMTKAAAGMLLAGVLLNELLLAVQGFAAFAYMPVPYINEALLAAALVLLCSAIAMVVSLQSNPRSGS